MPISERADKTNFYSRDSILDDIRAGIQTKLTESIANTHTRIYLLSIQLKAQNTTRKLFLMIKLLKNSLQETVVFNGVDVNLFNSNTINGKVMLSDYNATGLKALIDSTGTGMLDPCRRCYFGNLLQVTAYLHPLP